MGTPDTASNDKLSIQFKSGLNACVDYQVGDVIPIADGIHIGYGGAFVVEDGKLIYVTARLWDKWGGSLDPDSIINPINPVTQAIQELKDSFRGE